MVARNNANVTHVIFGITAHISKSTAHFLQLAESGLKRRPSREREETKTLCSLHQLRTTTNRGKGRDLITQVDMPKSGPSTKVRGTSRIGPDGFLPWFPIRVVGFRPMSFLCASTNHEKVSRLELQILSRIMLSKKESHDPCPLLAYNQHRTSRYFFVVCDTGSIGT